MTSKNTKELTSKTKNKILVLGLMLVVLVGIFGLINKVEAAPSCWYKGGIYGSNLGITPITDEAKCIAVGGAWGESAATSQGTLSGTNAPTNPNAEPTGSRNDCSFWNGNLVDCTASLLARIAWIIMSIMSWLLWLAGVLLNYVIKETIVTMKEGVDKMTGINIGWKVIRDVMNIGFIFLLVYEGIMMIIGQSGKDKVKKYIFSIVLAALLINFSLFFTKVLIDASNIITIGLYNSIIDSSSKATVTGNELTTDTVIERPIEGISAPFMSALKLQQLYGGNSFENISNAVGGGTNMLLFFLMGAVLFLILTFVFFAIAMMFIVRYITLIILLMTSPIAYIGSAIPGMSQYSKQWWDSLKGQLLFAPIYMLITMIVLKLIGSDGFIKTDGADWSGFVTGTANAVASGATTNSTMSLLLNFAVIIGLAIASLVIAKSTSTKGSKFIGQATGKLTEFAGGAIMGGTATLGRRTVGAAASRLAEQKQFQDWAGRSAVGERALKITRGTATGSFDVRASRAGQKTTDVLGVDFGKAQQGGYDKILADKTAKKEKFGQSLRGDQAKRDYAIRQASGIGILGGIGVRGGSGPNERLRTLAGTMGRSNRVVASKTLSSQLTNATTARDNARNRLDQLNDQETRMLNELSTINAAIAAGSDTTQQRARQVVLNGPVTDRRSLAYVQNEINIHNTAILPPLDNDVTNLRNDINRLGITNPNDVVLTPVQQQQNALATAAGLPPPHTGRDRRADEQNY